MAADRHGLDLRGTFVSARCRRSVPLRSGGFDDGLDGRVGGTNGCSVWGQARNLRGRSTRDAACDSTEC